MRRRQFISLLGGAAAAWPVAARGQQGERARRIGVLMSLAANDPQSRMRLTAFEQHLQQLGWTNDRSVRIDYRWGAAEPELLGRYTAELLALDPDVILATGTHTVTTLQKATRSLPIVFVQVIDPVGVGIVSSLAKPGGNVTGFTQFEYGMSAKWIELLKEIAPNVTRAAILRDPTIPSGIGELAAIQTAAPSFRVDLYPIGVRDAAEIEHSILAFANMPNSGLIVLPGPLAAVRRDLIIALAAHHRLPAVYAYRYFVAAGGLISYGPDTIDQYRRAAGYVDRILKGEKPADLPVQAPTKYELIINLKTAKALGLTIPPMLLARADEVIE